MRPNVTKPWLRLVVSTAIIIFAGTGLQAQEQKSQTNPGSACAEQSKGVPDFYYDAALKDITPPNWVKSLVRISVGGEIKLDLWTDGQKFLLWTNTNPQTVGDFLNGLDQSCSLPSDPSEAVTLMKVHWESTEISPEEFANLHRTFTSALMKYTSMMQSRYSSAIENRLSSVHLDAEGYPILYDNSHERVELFAWNESNQRPLNPLINWVHRLQRLAEDRFHRSFSYRPFR